MNATAGVFVLTGNASLVPMQVANFASEDDFQDLLAKFPALLAGDQIDAANPRRFVLIDREFPIAADAGEGARWSLDHLFLDQDGVPTLVEVKRGTDTRIRREVVGQMLDYAANAVAYWPMEALREGYVGKCEGLGRNPKQALTEDFGGEIEWERYWATVKANLVAGRIRLLFVADRIPSELRRVVEFLNVQMRPAEVLAVELRQFQGGELRTLAPIVIGQSQEALERKASADRKPRRPWDKERLLLRLSETSGSDAVDAARVLLAWMVSRGLRYSYNDAPSYGAVTAEIEVGAVSVPVFRLWTDGNLQILFAALARTPAFSEPSVRAVLLAEIRDISNIAIKAEAINGSPYVRLAAFTSDRCGRLLEVFDEVMRSTRHGLGETP